jgi:hypothetical protein
MLRYWQAYMSVKDTLYPHPVERTLTVYQEMVQIRLSILAVTIGAFLLAHLAAALVRTTIRRNRVRRIHLPSSRLGWMAQAAREHGCHAGPKAIPPHDRFHPTLFASQNQGLALIITPDFEPRIVTPNEISVPLLESTTAGSHEPRSHQPCEPYPSHPTSLLFDDRKKMSRSAFVLDV